MNGDGNPDVSGFYIEERQKHTNDRSISKLVQITMKKAEHQARNHHCHTLSVTNRSIHNQFAKYQFFHNRCKHHDIQNQQHRVQIRHHSHRLILNLMPADPA